jgi:hypothetical protein
MKTPLLTPVRIGQPGDVTLLLEPADPAEVERLQQYQIALQKLYGGRLMEPVHLTCQRFVLTDEQRYPALVEMLKDLGRQFNPPTLQANGVQPFYSRFRQENILKWEIVLDPFVESFSARLEQLLQTPWTASMYSPGWVSTLVTALVANNSEPSQPLEGSIKFPHPLFTPGILTLSKLLGPTEFEIMDKIHLWKS